MSAKGFATWPASAGSGGGAHASTHQAGGADAIKLDDLAAADDTTDLNVSITKHGLAPKLSNVATEFLNGTGGYTVPAGGAAGVLQTATVTLTDADYRAAATVPIPIGVAAGAGTVLIPICFQVVHEITAGFSVVSNLNIRYIGGAATGLASISTLATATGVKCCRSAASAGLTTNAAVNINVGLEVFGAATPTGGSTAAGFRVTVHYVVITYP